jgi:hypothetical protein
MDVKPDSQPDFRVAPGTGNVVEQHGGRQQNQNTEADRNQHEKETQVLNRKSPMTDIEAAGNRLHRRANIVIGKTDLCLGRHSLAPFSTLVHFRLSGCVSCIGTSIACPAHAGNAV